MIHSHDLLHRGAIHGNVIGNVKSGERLDGPKRKWPSSDLQLQYSLQREGISDSAIVEHSRGGLIENREREREPRLVMTLCQMYVSGSPATVLAIRVPAGKRTKSGVCIESKSDIQHRHANYKDLYVKHKVLHTIPTRAVLGKPF